MKTNQRIYLSCILALASCQAAVAFQPEEATIEGMQNAIKSGEITCRGVVQAYLERARAYNGVCTALVTADGASVKSGPGTVRAGKALFFPTKTVAANIQRFERVDLSGIGETDAHALLLPYARV